MTTETAASETAATAETIEARAADEILLGFTQALRAAGVPVTADRSQTFLRAVSIVGLDDRWSTYWAGRSTLCTRLDDFDKFDRVFRAWFSEWPEGGDPPRPPARAVPQAALEDDSVSGVPGGDEQDDTPALASATEVLRHRDIATMDAGDRARLAALFAELKPRAPRRPAIRPAPWHRGDLDARRTLRLMRARMGEPGPVAWRRRRLRARRLVLLVDISGSMSPYADALLRLAHVFSHATPPTGTTLRPGDVEVFTVGTRLTNITRAMRMRDPDRAIIAAGATVPDWSGGTRLGETLKVFLDRWGQRGAARGAVVVVVSDGWERGGTAVLAEQMRRLQQLARRVIWMNPHRGKAGYQPIQSGVVAALPYIDHFVAGHSMAAFAELCDVIAQG